MQDVNVELSVGDTVQIGDRLLTVIDIDGDEISFKLEDDFDMETVEMIAASSGTIPR